MAITSRGRRDRVQPRLGFQRRRLDRAISYSARPTLDVISHLTGRRDSQAPRAVIARALLRNKRADPPLETDGRAAPGRPDVMIADTVVVSWGPILEVDRVMQELNGIFTSAARH